MTRVLNYCILLFLSLYVPAIAYGQNFETIHYTVENGLPSNTIYQIYRDHNGFLWMATDKGVARYNGIKFDVFTSFDGLADNEIFFFKEDKNNRLWMGTYNGELCYYKDDSFHTAINTPFLRESSKASHICAISVEADSSIIIRFNNQCSFLNIKGNNCSIIYADRNKILSPDKYVICYKKIAPYKYAAILDNIQLQIDTSFNKLKIDTIKIGTLKRMAACQDQEYIYNDSEIFTTNLQMVRRIPKCLNINDIYEIYMANGYCFYTTKTGLYINDTLRMLYGEKVSSITQDIQGNFWISTLNDGIFEMKKNFFETKLYRNCYQGKAQFAQVYKDHIFFTTSQNELNELYNGKTRSIVNRSNSGMSFDKQEESIATISQERSYFCFYKNRVASIDDLLHPKITIWYKDLDNIIKSLYSLMDKLYVQVWDDIYEIDKSHSGDKHTINTITSTGERIFCMTAFDNCIWYSTIDHLYRIENRHGVLQNQFKKLTFKYFDFVGQYLVGYTHYNQLCICRNVYGNVLVDTIKSDNCIWGNKFYELDSNHILIGTNNLYRILTLHPQNSIPRYSILTVENPFIPIQAETVCSDTAHCYFFENGSVISVDIKSLLERPLPPQLFFKLVKTTNGSYPIQNNIELPFSESKNISISFSTLSPYATNVLYQYSVSKTEQDNWQDIKGDINLVHPAFGNYIIKVRAKSISSEYSSPILFSLNILRPFWATWWFIILSACVLLYLIAIFFRYRFRYELRKKEKAHQSEIKFMKSEYKALNALMNPHFIFNTLNNVQDLVNKNDKFTANEYLKIFANLIRQNMQNISEEQITLQKEIDLVTNYLLLEKLRFDEILNYSIEIDEALDLSEILVPPLLIQPLIENSIKHGIIPLQSDKGLLCIRIYEQNGHIYIEVKDNGVGMNAKKNKQASLYESYGLGNIKKRMEQLSIIQNKEFKLYISNVNDEYGNHTWTLVTVSLPV